MFSLVQFFASPPTGSLIYEVSYNPWWIVVSVLIAIFSSYAALISLERISNNVDRTSRLIWTVVSALTLGTGIWAMHFIGMLAIQLPCGIHYDPLITLISMIPGMLAGGVPIAAVWKSGKKPLPIFPASLLLAAGIGTMHYTGMAAMEMAGFLRYSPPLFSLSILVAIVLSYIALRIRNSIYLSGKRRLWMVAVVLGGAAAAMHYTGMAATYFVSGDVGAQPPGVFSPNMLAMIVAITSLFLTLIVLSLSTISRIRGYECALRQENEKTYAILRNASDGIHILDYDGNVIEASDSFCNMLGYGRDEVIGMNVSQWDVHFADQGALMSVVRSQFERKERTQFETKHRRKDGTLLDVEISGYPIAIEGRNVLFNSSRDITRRKEDEQNTRIAATAFNTQEGMMVTDAKARILKVNKAFTEITGYAPEEVIGKNPNILSSRRQDASFYESMWKRIAESGFWSGEVWNKKKNGELYPEQLTITVVKNDDGLVTNYVGSLVNIAERKLSEGRIQQLAYYDQLTGLPNRQLFQDRLDQSSKKISRSKSSLALLFIDLDRFKEVNDTLGHVKGDLLLIEAARRIRQHVREADTFSRLGGDEFAIILPEYGDESSIDRIVENVLDEMSMPFDLGDGAVGRISCSIGIALFPQDAESTQDLVKHADQAMYAAKEAGRNRFSYFTPLMQQEAREKLEFKNDLSYALSREELEVHYQPIVNLASGQIVKAEALLRWHHPTRGSVSPAQFIPLAEEFGLIIELGNWVFLQVIAAVMDWRDRLGYEVQVSVNCSPVEFDKHDFKWIELLKAAGLEGGAITMEITEGLLLKESKQVMARLIECRNYGIEVSIDDFGTGYSALSYLNQFDIDYLKIDQSFVRNLTTDKSSKALVEAIIVMAHKLGIKTIAEGVETEVQRDILQAFSCDFAQGYLYSRPVPAKEFEKLITE